MVRRFSSEEATASPWLQPESGGAEAEDEEQQQEVDGQHEREGN